MGKGRWLASNFLTADALAVSSAPAGLVGSVVPAAVAGSAELMAQGGYSGPVDRLYTVEIDGTTAGVEVGQATFRWRRSGETAWAASGIVTSASWLDLECGVQVKWIPGAGDDLVKGDRWMLAAARPRGLQALLDGNPNSEWRTTGVADEILAAFLTEERQATVLVLGHHNLTAGATVTLDQGLILDLDPTQGSAVDRAGFQELACLRDDPVWGLRDGVLTEFPPHTVAQVDDPTGGGGYVHAASPPSGNLLPYSQDLGNAWWSKARCSIGGPVEGPDGDATGWEIVSDTEFENHYLGTPPNLAISEDQTYTLSWFAKPGDKGWLMLRVRQYDAYQVALDTTDQFLEVTGGPYNGWQRISYTFTAVAGATKAYFSHRLSIDDTYGGRDFSGDGVTVDMYMTGFQLEALNGAGPYIPTNGAPVSVVTEPNDFSVYPWDLVRCSLSAPVTGPTGGDAYGIIADGQTRTHYFSYAPTPKIAVKEGQRWKVTAYAKRGNKSLVRFTAWFYDSGNSYLGPLSAEAQTIPDTGDWEGMQFTFDVPHFATPDNFYMTFALYLLDDDGSTSWAGDGATVNVYLAEVTVTPLAAASRGSETLYLAQIGAVQGALQGAGSLRAEVIFGFDPVAGPPEAGLVTVRDWFSSLLYYDPAGTLKTRDSTSTAVASLAWSANTAYELAVRWGAGQMQVGADDAWGTAAAFDGEYDADTPARIQLARDLILGPIYFRRVRMWNHRDEAATPAAVGDAYTQALTVTSPHLVHFMDQTASAWRVLLQDADNPDGYLRVALVHLGAYFEPSQNYAPGFVEESQGAGTEQATGGSVTGRTVTGLAEHFTLAYSNASPADLASFRAVFEAAHSLSQRRAVPCWLVPDSDSPAGALFGLVGPLMTRRAVSPVSDHRQVELTFQELPRRRA